MVYERIAKVAKQFLGVSVLDAGYVLADEQVPLAVRDAHAVRPRQPHGARPASASRSSPCGSSRASRPHDAAGGFFNRMSRWFRR